MEISRYDGQKQCEVMMTHLLFRLPSELVYPVVAHAVAELLFLAVQDVLRAVRVFGGVERLAHDVFLGLALRCHQIRFMILDYI